MNCPILIVGHELLARLHVVSLKDYDVIFIIDFLSSSYTVVDNYAKRVVFKIIEETKFIIYGSNSTSPSLMISVLQAQKVPLGWCSRFFTTLVKAKSEGPVLDDISIVKEFPNVFSKNLLGQLPDKEVEFSIK